MAAGSQKMRVDLRVSGPGVRAVALQAAANTVPNSTDDLAADVVLERAERFARWITGEDVEDDQ